MHLLISDLLLPRAHARDVLARLELPGLVALLRQASHGDAEPVLPSFQRTMPATRWLLRTSGVEADAQRAPLAPLLRMADGLAADANTWFAALPCHFALARDHVQLGGLGLELTADEARSLFDAAAPVLAAAGATLDMGTPERWYLGDPALAPLLTSEPERALGRNVDIWLPTVQADADAAPARRWRKLHNEVQMIWHMHPVNREREARGAPTINALWLYGGGTAAPTTTGAEAGPVLAPGLEGVAARSDQSLLHCLAARADLPVMERSPASRALVWLDELSHPAACENWAAWRETLAGLERTWFAPLAASRRTVTLTLCSEHAWRTCRRAPAAAWKFWRRASLPELLVQ